ncbi:hypothetical protein GCM10012275_39150 [Longimycelium tulufanense]|uniref:Phage portal protein n=1 Tax=Longimycelium tulufanense TaxID=907463 RepID=A0A8J3CDU5_9PSEU|nr:phage portal protein [Longimycelium tulufanense]GGM64712.1 hypothetical protein GCM10012275_39150 [Longimycelium tulufanense]
MTSVGEHVDRLSHLITSAKPKLTTNEQYYEAEHRLKALGVATPPEMRHLVAAIGWPRMYVDSVEERLDVEGFRLAGRSDGDERLWSWWQANGLDEESGLGHLEALIHGRAYVTVAAPDPGSAEADQDAPVIRAESPLTMIAETDPRTRQITRALRLYRSPDAPSDDAATLYLPDETLFLQRDSPAGRWSIVNRVAHQLGVVPVVPLVNRARLADRAGQSEITPEIRSVTDTAARIAMDMQAAAELMAVPQRLLFGVSRDEFTADPDNPGAALEAYYARIMAFENEAGKALQFAAADLRNFTEVLGELAKQVASYTGLPPQYLSFSSDNPASAEAIRSSEARLIKKAERKARLFGGSWEQVMRLGMRIMGDSVPEDAYRLETVWRDPATPTYASKADAASKLYANGMGIIPLERARIDMGYTSEERREMRRWDAHTPTSQLAALMQPRSPGAGEDGGQEGEHAA